VIALLQSAPELGIKITEFFNSGRLSIYREKFSA